MHEDRQGRPCREIPCAGRIIIVPVLIRMNGQKSFRKFDSEAAEEERPTIIRKSRSTGFLMRSPKEAAHPSYVATKRESFGCGRSRMEIIQARWNLSRDGGRRPRILFLADRNILADQAFNAFSAFPEDALLRDQAPGHSKKRRGSDER